MLALIERLLCCLANISLRCEIETRHAASLSGEATREPEGVPYTEAEGVAKTEAGGVGACVGRGVGAGAVTLTSSFSERVTEASSALSVLESCSSFPSDLDANCAGKVSVMVW